MNIIWIESHQTNGCHFLFDAFLKYIARVDVQIFNLLNKSQKSQTAQHIFITSFRPRSILFSVIIIVPFQEKKFPFCTLAKNGFPELSLYSFGSKRTQICVPPSAAIQHLNELKF